MVVARWVEPRPQMAVDVPDYLRDLMVKDRATPDQARGLIYRALVRAANRSLPTPSQWVLAIICGYDSASGTVEPIKRLERRGLIKVDRFQRGRRVTICHSGKSTRYSGAAVPHWRARGLIQSQQVETEEGSMATIYGLYDRDGSLRYIGKANNPADRLASHMRDSRRRDTPLYRWIRKRGMPEMRVLAVCDDWEREERRLIAEARARGERLLNVADGGEQPYCSLEVRRENGRRSAVGGYLASLKEDRFADLVHRLKRELSSLLAFYVRLADVEGVERVHEKMRRMARQLPEHFPKWVNL